MNNYRHKLEMLSIIRGILLAILVAIVVRTFIINSTIIDGRSMFSTLKNEDRLLVNNLIYIFKKPKSGDIISIESPDSKEETYIKRVIATEGDEVKISNGKVYINGKEMEENYIDSESYTNDYKDNFWKISKGTVFVLGDNRELNASKDSRNLGPIPKKLIKGKAFFRYYPIESFGTIN